MDGEGAVVLRLAAAAVFIVLLIRLVWLNMPLPESKRSHLNKPSCVIVFARHGDRTPGIMLSEDGPYWAEKIAFKPSTSVRSQLTIRGMENMQKIGSALKVRYGNILERNISKVKIYSTDYDRTKQCARVVGQTLLGKDDVSVTWRTRSQDPLDPWESIPSYQAAVVDFWVNNKSALAMLDKFRSYQDRLLAGTLHEVLAGREFSWIEALDVAVCAAAYPDSPRSRDLIGEVEGITRVTHDAYELLYDDVPLRRMGAGAILDGVCDWFVSKTEMPSPKRRPGEPVFAVDTNADFAFVSCHDVTLIPLMSLLKWPSSGVLWPPYAFNIAFELEGDEVTIRDSFGVIQRYNLDEFVNLCAKEGYPA